MKYPEFFNTIPTIKLQDSLADFLGSFEDGIVEFSYLDIVKSAGHSCPTVAGAYLLTLIGLQELYPNQLPKRGEIKISFKEKPNEGVAGVIANVMGHITGATQKSGFKGIGDNFKRYNLIEFSTPITSSVKFTRIDTNQTTQLIYNPNFIFVDPNIQTLMKKLLSGDATGEEKKLFRTLWQQRVADIFANIDKVITIV